MGWQASGSGFKRVTRARPVVVTVVRDGCCSSTGTYASDEAVSYATAVVGLGTAWTGWDRNEGILRLAHCWVLR